MKMKAIEKGFYGNKVVQVGETIDVPEGKKCSWAVPVKEYKEETVKSEDQLAKDAKEGSQGKHEKPAKKEKSEKKTKKPASKKPAAKKE